MARPLPPVDVAAREERARQALAASAADCLIVTGLSNVRWLTGFAGSNATVLLSADGLTLFTDSRYADRAPNELSVAGSSAELVIGRDVSTPIRERVSEIGVDTVVGLEAEYVTWAQHRLIAGSWLPDHELVATEELLDRVRAVKDDAEIARIQAAADAVDAALAATAPRLADGLTERQFATELEARIRSGGADDLGFDTIVASGPNGATPHHAAGDRVIEAGDLVIIDVGGKVDGYRSDMTRTFSVGPMTTEQARHYDTVIAAQQAGVQAMVVGAQASEVDAAARALIADAGWADSFTHGTGHGVGLDIHEMPRVGATSIRADVYEDGTVATVEPGVYLRGIAGVRIEDTCVATAAHTDGALRLTRFPKDPEI